MLQARLLGLKYRALYPDLSTAGQHKSTSGSSSNRQSPLDPNFTGDVLRDTIKIQQLSLESVKTVISNYVVRAYLSEHPAIQASS